MKTNQSAVFKIKVDNISFEVEAHDQIIRNVMKYFYLEMTKLSSQDEPTSINVALKMTD